MKSPEDPARMAENSVIPIARRKGRSPSFLHASKDGQIPGNDLKGDARHHSSAGSQCRGCSMPTDLSECAGGNRSAQCAVLFLDACEQFLESRQRVQGTEVRIVAKQGVIREAKRRRPFEQRQCALALAEHGISRSRRVPHVMRVKERLAAEGGREQLLRFRGVAPFRAEQRLARREPRVISLHFSSYAIFRSASARAPRYSGITG